MGDVEDFQRRVKRDDYVRHVWYLGAGFGGAVLGIVLCEWLKLPLVGLLFGAPFFFLSGLSAIWGKKSAITGIGARAGVFGYDRSWTTRELEDMSPVSRARHARLTGGHLMVIGCFLIGIEAFAGYHRYRRSLEEDAVKATGSISRELGLRADSVGLSDTLVCSVGDLVVACLDSELEMSSPVYLSHYAGTHIAVSGSLVVWSAEGGMTAARVEGESSKTIQQRSWQRDVTALAVHDSRATFVADDALYVWTIDAGDSTELRELAKEVGTEQPLLAMSSEHAWVAGGAKCALLRSDLKAEDPDTGNVCIAAQLDVCAITFGDGTPFVTARDGRLLRVDGKEDLRELGRWPGACGVGVSGGQVSVVANDGVYSLPTGGGAAKRLLKRNDGARRRIAGANQRRFYWLEGATLESVLVKP